MQTEAGSGGGGIRRITSPAPGLGSAPPLSPACWHLQAPPQGSPIAGPSSSVLWETLHCFSLDCPSFPGSPEALCLRDSRSHSEKA